MTTKTPPKFTLWVLSAKGGTRQRVHVRRNRKDPTTLCGADIKEDSKQLRREEDIAEHPECATCKAIRDRIERTRVG